MLQEPAEGGVVLETRNRRVGLVGLQRMSRVVAVVTQHGRHVQGVQDDEEPQARQPHQIILTYFSPFEEQECLTQRMLQQFVLALLLETLE